jgi:hypothetical protein
MNPYRSELTPNFVRLFRKLPVDVRQRARVAYRRWRENPNLPGLRFKRVWASGTIYSARIDAAYRVVGELEGDLMKWDFIGNHDDYVRYIESL